MQSLASVWLLRHVPWLFAIVALAGAAALLRVERLAAAEPPTVVDRIREMRRLEVLEITTHRTVHFAPDPVPQQTLLADVLQYARETVAPRRGRAIVFAEAHFFVDLRKLDEGQVRAQGDEISLVLPDPELDISLSPGETEIIASNLDSAQTASMLESAQGQLRHSLAADPLLKARARAAAERSLGALLRALGFRTVRFDTGAPALPHS
jgi:hypothetical protein